MISSNQGFMGQMLRLPLPGSPIFKAMLNYDVKINSLNLHSSGSTKDAFRLSSDPVKKAIFDEKYVSDKLNPFIIHDWNMLPSDRAYILSKQFTHNMKAHPCEATIIPNLPVLTFAEAIALPKGSDLMPLLHHFLLKLKEQGHFAKLHRQVTAVTVQVSF